MLMAEILAFEEQHRARVGLRTVNDLIDDLFCLDLSMRDEDRESLSDTERAVIAAAKADVVARNAEVRAQAMAAAKRAEAATQEGLQRCLVKIPLPTAGGEPEPIPQGRSLDELRESFANLVRRLPPSFRDEAHAILDSVASEHATDSVPPHSERGLERSRSERGHRVATKRSGGDMPLSQG